MSALPLNSYLPYLINRLGPPVEAGFAAPLKTAGIDLQSWRVLAVLYEYGDQPVGALSRLTSIPVSTLSRLISRMAAKNLVSRRRDGGDARSVTVHLLKSGAAKAEMLIPHAAAYEKRLTRDFTEAEIATFKTLLAKFYEGMTDRAGRTNDTDDRMAG